MKFYLKPVLSVVILAVLLGYAGCKGTDNPPTPEDEVQLGKLSSTWKVAGNGTDVTLDGSSRKSEYSNFQLTLTGTPGATSFGYTTTGRPPLSAWPSSGSWNFGSTVATDVVRDQGTSKEVSMTYTVTDSQLELTFTYNGAGEARTSDVTGVWVFRLTK
ncbi:MAG TPA: hypothetical protein VK508_08625 [Cyclobacteriaceae bacterium]|nr:hypothetical protein [Cyclobacteriaceae bacterium]